ncbi:Uncharacterized protein APZ42_017313 [Daphnia magna]|uniref:Uncharacterized protein n=1 Tax=Daphnia magna TaxID=35525 RepID=A0A164ZSB2_9CRUS|nr:Uncharacterized protein APZ42_017313 [Daphnia magna]
MKRMSWPFSKHFVVSFALTLKFRDNQSLQATVAPFKKIEKIKLNTIRIVVAVAHR